MKPAAVLYCATIDYLREVAKQHGYALAVHGTMARDLDLVACPWTEDAVAGAVLAEALRRKLELCSGDVWSFEIGNGVKPHGRIAWTIVPHCGGGMYVDLSIMPLAHSGRRPVV
jgi:hypothetical protein